MMREYRKYWLLGILGAACFGIGDWLLGYVDPRIVNNPQLINYLSYDELRELSYMGAAYCTPNPRFPCRRREFPSI